MKKNATIFVCFFALIFLTACATPGDLRNNRPDFEGSSSKKSQAVAGCIADKFEAFTQVSSVLNTNVRPTKSGYMVEVLGNVGYSKDTNFLADIDDTDEGSTTRFYIHGVLGRHQERINEVASCQ